ncbi:hypothetical protein B5E84_13025 [Lachnoclostridium sp. An14]|uniref:helix-turn-helix domain-containing protein n=1 Tax=Lachnoclostridium sp. An14 TaxID=1965562 RepID=UPI000B3ABC5E|nr:helix-turn-helix transcriptional regulator [Lachnoclostridium sp. An14]OUQ16097.1 hypothetical protein B5E84_13025 [Lachnoclostridium sp. An14]
MRINKLKLQIAMANACLSMDELAKKAGISRISLTQYSSGNTNPRTKTLGKIAKALGVSVESLIDMEGD